MLQVTTSQDGTRISPPTMSELTPGWPETKSLMLWPTQVVPEDQLPFAGLPRRISTNQQRAWDSRVERYSSILRCSGRRLTVFLIQWFGSLRLMLQQTCRQLPWSWPQRMFLPSTLKRRHRVRRGLPLHAVAALRSKYARLAGRHAPSKTVAPHWHVRDSLREQL